MNVNTLKTQLKPHWEKVQAWWHTLELREKQAVAIGGSVLGIFLFYECIWSPYLNHINTMRTGIKTQEKTLLWMQAADKEISKMESHSINHGKSISPVTLLGYLQKQIQHAGLEGNMTQLKQASNDSIEMHFQKVEFDKLIKLLTQICKEQKVAISQMSANSENAPGIVNADAVIKIG